MALGINRKTAKVATAIVPFEIRLNLQRRVHFVMIEI